MCVYVCADVCICVLVCVCARIVCVYMVCVYLVQCVVRVCMCVVLCVRVQVNPKLIFGVDNFYNHTPNQNSFLDFIFFFNRRTPYLALLQNFCETNTQKIV